MTEPQTSISATFWYEKFHPLMNREGQPRVFQPTGDDLISITAAPVEHVWTLLSPLANEQPKIISGFDPMGIGFHLAFVPRTNSISFTVE